MMLSTAHASDATATARTGIDTATATADVASIAPSTLPLAATHPLFECYSTCVGVDLWEVVAAHGFTPQDLVSLSRVSRACYAVAHGIQAVKTAALRTRDVAMIPLVGALAPFADDAPPDTPAPCSAAVTASAGGPNNSGCRDNDHHAAATWPNILFRADAGIDTAIQPYTPTTAHYGCATIYTPVASHHTLTRTSPLPTLSALRAMPHDNVLYCVTVAPSDYSY